MKASLAMNLRRTHSPLLAGTPLQGGLTSGDTPYLEAWSAILASGEQPERLDGLMCFPQRVVPLPARRAIMRRARLERQTVRRVLDEAARGIRHRYTRMKFLLFIGDEVALTRAMNEVHVGRDAAGEAAHDVAYIDANRRYRSALLRRATGRVSDDPVTGFRALTARWDCPPLLRYFCTLQTLVHIGRLNDRTRIGELRLCAGLAGEMIEALAAEHHGSPKSLLMSVHYRATAFVPFLAGDRDATLRALDRCLLHAHRAIDGDKLDRALARDNMYPVLQTRLRTFRAFGMDREACDALRTFASFDPTDAFASIAMARLAASDGDVGDARKVLLGSIEAGGFNAEAAAVELVKLARQHGVNLGVRERTAIEWSVAP